jgi:hypothetical protein
MERRIELQPKNVPHVSLTVAATVHIGKSTEFSL